MTHSRLISNAERDTMIQQATSAAQCWLVVWAGAALTGLVGLMHLP